MGKRGNNNHQNNDNQKRKKFKVSTGFLDPGTSGIYASCTRRKERLAAQELGQLLEEKMEQYYKEEIEELHSNSKDNTTGETKDHEDSNKEQKVEDLSIEEQLKKELANMRKPQQSKTKDEKKKDILQLIDLNCECMIFFKTRRPIVPEKFVKRIMEDLSDPNDKLKRTRYIQRLTPITNSCSASMEQMIKLANQILAPHFHEPNGRHDYKFSIELTRRNFNTIERNDIINQIVALVCQNGKYQHQVDLKNYEKLIIVECFKNNIGMSVVGGDYLKKYKKYNIQSIFEAKFKDNKINDDKDINKTKN
ncbi:putative tRNA acetyltransferase PWA37_004762 [Arxiozyma heterogenica]|uniref:putative tRNA acetyltransferase n=1 Tax=Arxiozyma heterogenica TaxID=278026 RepID=UPI002F1D23D9